MDQLNANAGDCGIRNLLRLLTGQGFTEAELKKSPPGSRGRLARTSFFVAFHH